MYDKPMSGHSIVTKMESIVDTKFSQDTNSESILYEIISYKAHKDEHTFFVTEKYY